MTELEQALQIANKVLDFDIQFPTAFYVHGDPDCDACILARQLIRQHEALEGAFRQTIDHG